MLRLGVGRQSSGIRREKSKWAASSLRFSARLKCTRPTRFHAALQRFKTPERRTSIRITPAQKRYAVLARETGEHLPSGTPPQSSEAPREPAKPVPHRAAMDYALLWSRLHRPAECRGPSRSALRILAIGEGGGECDSDFACSELEKTMARSRAKAFCRRRASSGSEPMRRDLRSR